MNFVIRQFAFVSNKRKKHLAPLTRLTGPQTLPWPGATTKPNYAVKYIITVYGCQCVIDQAFIYIYSKRHLKAAQKC